VFRAKTTICSAKFGDLGLMGTCGKICRRKSIFGIADPDLPIHYATFMGGTMMIKGSLLLSPLL